MCHTHLCTRTMGKRRAVVSSGDEDENEVVSEDMDALLFELELVQYMEDELERNLAESEPLQLLDVEKDHSDIVDPPYLTVEQQHELEIMTYYQMECESYKQHEQERGAMEHVYDYDDMGPAAHPEPVAEAAGAEVMRSSKRAAAAAAFRHLKVQGAMVHVHPSLCEEDVNAVLEHVASTKYGAAKDLFIMACDIEGALLVVSPRMVSTQPGVGMELICDHIAFVDGVDVRVLTPMLIWCSTAEARRAVIDAIGGGGDCLGELCLLCSKPSATQIEAVQELGLSLQVLYACTRTHMQHMHICLHTAYVAQCLMWHTAYVAQCLMWHTAYVAQCLMWHTAYPPPPC